MIHIMLRRLASMTTPTQRYAEVVNSSLRQSLAEEKCCCDSVRKTIGMVQELPRTIDENVECRFFSFFGDDYFPKIPIRKSNQRAITASFLLIFDDPKRRSTKMIGTSAKLAPTLRSRNRISSWNEYPFETNLSKSSFFNVSVR